jgi:hypothetical protein
MHPRTHITPKGTLCIPTGRYFMDHGGAAENQQSCDYIEVQIASDLNRFERVRKSNLQLHPDLRSGKKGRSILE